jgi:invasion protein IalB
MRISTMTAFMMLATSPAVLAQEWFLHSFGELRAYHGDWLAVCEDEGAGACRMVQTGKDTGSDAYFDNRIALHRIDGTPDWAVVLMDRGMPAESLSSVWVVIDGVRVDIPLWTVGELDQANVAETITLTDATLTARIVEAMKAGNRMVFHYAPVGTGDGMSRYSLRGVTAAAQSIEARVLARQE